MWRCNVVVSTWAEQYVALPHMLLLCERDTLVSSQPVRPAVFMFTLNSKQWQSTSYWTKILDMTWECSIQLKCIALRGCHCFQLRREDEAQLSFWSWNGRRRRKNTTRASCESNNNVLSFSSLSVWLILLGAASLGVCVRVTLPGCSVTLCLTNVRMKYSYLSHLMNGNGVYELRIR